MRCGSPLCVVLFTSLLAGCGKPADGGNAAGAETADSLYIRGLQNY